MNIDKSLAAYIKYLPIIFIFVLVSTIATIASIKQEYFLNEEMVKSKQIYLEHEKELLKLEVGQLISLFDFRIKQNDTPLDKLKTKLLNRVSNINFGEQTFIYIVDDKGLILSHENSDIIGQNAFNFKDPFGKYYMKEGYELAQKDGSAFIEYLSVTNNDKSLENKEKLTYVEYYKPFGWSIYAGVYISHIDKKLQKRTDQIKQKYEETNSFLIGLAIVFVVIVISVSIFLSRKVTRMIEKNNLKFDEQNRLLAKLVKDKTSRLRHNLGFTNKLINTIPIPVFVKDKDFKYIDCNQAFCDFFDKPKKEIIGKTIYDIADKEISDYSSSKDVEMIDSRLSYQSYKFTYHDSMDHRVLEIHKAKFMHKKNISGILGIIFDITEKELLANSLKQEIAVKTIQNLKQTKILEEEQLKNIKFTAIGQLAAGITHEINTPLTYIMGNFEMMNYDIGTLPENETKSRIQEDAARINEGLKRIANIIESMREMSQKSKEEKEYVNIYHTLATSLTMAFNRSKQISKIFLNDIEFNIDIDKDKEIYKSFVQRQRIEQVWIIIINNALDELVNIDDYEKRKLVITIGFNQVKDMIVVKFKDNAGGISQSIIDKIFEPFVSTKEHSGIGIGLNVARKIIDDQDGTILAYNEGDGAVFEVRLKYSGADEQ